MKPFVLAVCILLLVLLSTTGLSATIRGTVYNDNLDPESDVLINVNSTPLQKYLSKDGRYQFDLAPGSYVLQATKGGFTIAETIEIHQDEEFIIDLFLLPSLAEEDDLWQDTELDVLGSTEKIVQTRFWAYIVAGTIFAILLGRAIYIRKKYGSLRLFRKRIKMEAAKTREQHAVELAQEPGYATKALEIIKNHDGRITQKELRKEMLYLSEAKVSLIVTELEHKRLIEKIKKGRGNVLVLKSQQSAGKPFAHLM